VNIAIQIAVVIYSRVILSETFDGRNIGQIPLAVLNGSGNDNREAVHSLFKLLT